MHTLKTVILLLLFAHGGDCRNGSFILFFFQPSAYSHRLGAWPVVDELVECGHQVVLNQILHARCPNPNATEFSQRSVQEDVEMLTKSRNQFSYNQSERPPIEQCVFVFPVIGLMFAPLALCTPLLSASDKTLYGDTDTTMDSIVFNVLYNECATRLYKKIGAKNITHSSKKSRGVWIAEMNNIVAANERSCKINVVTQTQIRITNSFQSITFDAPDPVARTRFSGAATNAAAPSIGLDNTALRRSESNFEEMRKCLERSGLATSNIVLRSNSAKYESLNYQFMAQPSVIYPRAYILVQSEEDIMSVVRCGRRHTIRVVPKSGGHSLTKYSFGDSHTVVVDLRDMSDIILTKSTLTVEVGPGSLIGAISRKLWNAGQLFIPFGSATTLGISGLSTGGGYGYFSREYGLTVDQILEMNVVIANGTLLKVNNATNTDLYWALRGSGGGNFGIVSKFLFKVTPAPLKIFMGTLSYNMSVFTDIYDVWQLYFLSNPPRPIFSELFAMEGILTIVFTDATGQRINFDHFQKQFPPPFNSSSKVLSYPDFVVASSAVLSLRHDISYNSFDEYARLTRDSLDKRFLKVKSYFVNTIASADKIIQLSLLMKEIPTGVLCLFGTYGGGAISDVAINETALLHRDARLLAIGTYSAEKDDFQYRTALVWLQKFYDLGSLLFNSTQSYSNYMDSDLKDFLAQYHGSNLQRLVEIKRHYDPENYFNFPQSIPTHI